jgi:hypothetical protein
MQGMLHGFVSIPLTIEPVCRHQMQCTYLIWVIALQQYIQDFGE